MEDDPKQCHLTFKTLYLVAIIVLLVVIWPDDKFKQIQVQLTGEVPTGLLIDEEEFLDQVEGIIERPVTVNRNNREVFSYKGDIASFYIADKVLFNLLDTLPIGYTIGNKHIINYIHSQDGSK